jgi:hypothetical protein
MTRSIKAATVALAFAVAASACAKQVVSSGSTVGSSLVVEQFMRAANAKDLDAMARMFGTTEGPVFGRWPKDEIEKRMYVISTELKHEDFAVTAEQIVPGRGTDATKLTVKIRKDGKDYNVPFTLVRYKDTRWLVEQIGIDVITAPR